MASLANRNNQSADTALLHLHDNNIHQVHKVLGFVRLRPLLYLRSNKMTHRHSIVPVLIVLSSCNIIRTNMYFLVESQQRSEEKISAALINI